MSDQTQIVYATRADLEELRKAQHDLGLDVAALQVELRGIRKSLDQISDNISKGVWLVVGGVLLAFLGQVLVK